MGSSAFFLTAVVVVVLVPATYLCDPRSVVDVWEMRCGTCQKRWASNRSRKGPRGVAGSRYVCGWWWCCYRREGKCDLWLVVARRGSILSSRPDLALDQQKRGGRQSGSNGFSWGRDSVALCPALHDATLTTCKPEPFKSQVGQLRHKKQKYK